MIIATCISIIIQMILPNGKNKKYAEIVSRLYILYVILNPILNLDSSFAISEVKNTISEISNERVFSQEEMARNYILGLENELKETIEETGIEVEYIQFYITTDYSNIAKIEVKIKSEINDDENKIKNIVLEKFHIEKENVIVKKDDS